MAKDTFNRLDDQKKAKIIHASVLEFSRTIPDHINIQNIIRDAEIPRGSFYQYFENKEDLYLYILDYIGQEKQKFFNKYHLDLNKSFTSYISDAYILGYAFMLEHPLLYKAGKNMMSFEYFKQFDMLANAENQASLFYQSLITRDQKQGLINKDIDPVILAELALSFIDTPKLDTYYEQGISLDTFKIKMEQIILILKKGIEAYV